jgi:hypothetical protein
MTEMRITKVGHDRYHAEVDDMFTNLDENVNDSQLLGMLESKKLVDGTSDGILALLDLQHVGYEVIVTYE